MQLTAEQRAIVAHRYGPARVFAVAGAGKTTAMVHRIHQLILDNVFVPDRILASSFSRASVQDLRRALGQWPACRQVKTQTLHSLCYQVIRCACRRGYFQSSPIEPNQVNTRLYHQAVGQLRERRPDLKETLEEVDSEDFLTYVSYCKGRLEYSDLSCLSLPESGPHAKIARQADPPEEEGLAIYFELYRLFERIRRAQHWISFDDMLMTGWELLVRHQDLRREFQHRFDCIIVDEFQDVNRAQFAVLDLLSHGHRNYMVVGDDDQTIYEWRGAEVRFMLKEFDRYQPVDYTITDNFRCQASQVALANAVIRHNRHRRSKAMQLTQGFRGNTQIHRDAKDEQLAVRVVQETQKALQASVAATDIAILVRIYAQTPYIEQKLIAAEIPYWGPELVPFYRRRITLDFLAWARLADLDQILEQGSLTPAQEAEWEEAWCRARQLSPVRYLHRAVKERLYRAVTGGDCTLRQGLIELNGQTRGLGTLAKWLKMTSQGVAAKVALLHLDQHLGYRDAWCRRRGSKAGGRQLLEVDAIIDYAQGKGDLSAFLQHLDDLQRAEQYARDRQSCVCLTTIHQAKGLEWSVVMVPHCNQGLLPFGMPSSMALEEERRLMYVALTRAKRELHLFVLASQPESQFLAESQAQELLGGVRRISQLLSRSLKSWTAQDAIAFLQALENLNVQRYFQHWWQASPQLKGELAATLIAVYQIAAQRNLLQKFQLSRVDLAGWQSLAQSYSGEPPSTDALEQQLQKTASLLGQLQIGDAVCHRKYGRGTVQAIVPHGAKAGDLVTVDFEVAGQKQILITATLCTLERIPSKLGGSAAIANIR